MAQPESQDRVVAKDFPGLMTNADPEDLQPGSASRQVNARSERPGVLSVRRGYVRVKFEE